MLKDAVKTDFLKEKVKMEDGRYIVFYEFPSEKSSICDCDQERENKITSLQFRRRGN